MESGKIVKSKLVQPPIGKYGEIADEGTREFLQSLKLRHEDYRMFDPPGDGSCGDFASCAASLGLRHGISPTVAAELLATRVNPQGKTCRPVKPLVYDVLNAYRENIRIAAKNTTSDNNLEVFAEPDGSIPKPLGKGHMIYSWEMAMLHGNPNVVPQLWIVEESSDKKTWNWSQVQTSQADHFMILCRSHFFAITPVKTAAAWNVLVDAVSTKKQPDTWCPPLPQPVPLSVLPPPPQPNVPVLSLPNSIVAPPLSSAAPAAPQVPLPAKQKDEIIYNPANNTFRIFCDYELGPTAKEILSKRLDVTLGDSKKPYGHPALRALANLAHAHALHRATGQIIDVGSKYATIHRWLPYFQRSPLFRCYRPLLSAYDVKYVMNYPVPQGVEVIRDEDGIACKLTEATLRTLQADTKGPATLMMLDSVYYGLMPLALKFVASSQDREAVVSFTQYNTTLGRHHYPDSEGYYIIKSVEDDAYLHIENHPRENDVAGGYQHRVFNWSPEPTMKVYRVPIDHEPFYSVVLVEELFSQPYGDVRFVTLRIRNASAEYLDFNLTRLSPNEFLVARPEIPAEVVTTGHTVRIRPLKYRRTSSKLVNPPWYKVGQKIAYFKQELNDWMNEEVYGRVTRSVDFENITVSHEDAGYAQEVIAGVPPKTFSDMLRYRAGIVTRMRYGKEGTQDIKRLNERADAALAWWLYEIHDNTSLLTLSYMKDPSVLPTDVEKLPIQLDDSPLWQSLLLFVLLILVFYVGPLQIIGDLSLFLIHIIANLTWQISITLDYATGYALVNLFRGFTPPGVDATKITQEIWNSYFGIQPHHGQIALWAPLSLFTGLTETARARAGLVVVNHNWWHYPITWYLTGNFYPLVVSCLYLLLLRGNYLSSRSGSRMKGFKLSLVAYTLLVLVLKNWETVTANSRVLPELRQFVQPYYKKAEIFTNAKYLYEMSIHSARPSFCQADRFNLNPTEYCAFVEFNLDTIMHNLIQILPKFNNWFQLTGRALVEKQYGAPLHPLTHICYTMWRFTWMRDSDWTERWQASGEDLKGCQTFLGDPADAAFRGGCKPEHLQPRHLEFQRSSKLDDTDNDAAVNLKYYDVAWQLANPGASTKQIPVLPKMTGQQKLEYYSKFCTCRTAPGFYGFGHRVWNALTFRWRTPYTYSRCCVNEVAALQGRHFGTELKPDPQVVEELGKFAAQYKAPFQKEMDRQATTGMSFQDYVAKMDPGRRKNAQRGFDSLNAGNPIKLTLSAIVKTGEINYNDADEMGNTGELSRPRQIWSPDVTLKALPGLLNQWAIKSLKKIAPGFICGYSNDELARKLTEDHYFLKRHCKKVSTLVFDGSSHDSHQHWSIIEKTDNVFLDKTTAWMAARGHGVWMGTQVQKAVCSTALPAECRITIAGKSVLLYTVEVRGTTFSGHPTRTTWGNSLRVLLYICFIFFTIGVLNVFTNGCNQIRVYVAGDDVMIKGEHYLLLLFRDVMMKYYAPDTKKRTHGLGQCAKTISILGEFDFEFLSKDAVFQAGYAIFRTSLRTAQGSHFTDSVPRTRKAPWVGSWYCYQIAGQLSSWGSSLPFYSALASTFAATGELMKAYQDETSKGSRKSTKSTQRITRIIVRFARRWRYEMARRSETYDHPLEIHQGLWETMEQLRYDTPQGFSLSRSSQPLQVWKPSKPALPAIDHTQAGGWIAAADRLSHILRGSPESEVGPIAS